MYLITNLNDIDVLYISNLTPTLKCINTVNI